MTEKTHRIKIAVVGAGPRGLGSIEALVAALANDDLFLELTIFDKNQRLGAGPNFDPKQTPNCILNVPTRVIDIKPKLNLPCDDFESWQQHNGIKDADHFPTRASLGEYLMERFKNVVQFGGHKLQLNVHENVVIGMHSEGDLWFLETETGKFGPFDEVLLTQGQPQTKPDKQIRQWMEHMSGSASTLMSAYPDRELLSAAKKWKGRRIGVRGLGLSTFDVLRVLTLGLGGRFIDGAYVPSGSEPSAIYAFSLDGKPPYPKPVDGEYDQCFDIKPQEMNSLTTALEQVVSQKTCPTLDVVCAKLMTITSRIGSELDAKFDKSDIEEWLSIECKSPGKQESLGPFDTLKLGISLAKGETAPTIGYIIGQVWRKFQNELRIGFNSIEMVPELAKMLVEFDESLKRYSYGPPLQSSIELLALVECGLVSLNVVEDPDIQLIKDGWKLIESDDQAAVSVMVDAVLPTPSLNAVIDPLVGSLKENGLVREVYENAGAFTQRNGQLISKNGEAQTGLSLLGRLALGSVIAVDSIHDCFGAASTRWAEGVVKRAAS